jgi:hypothetical protein
LRCGYKRVLAEKFRNILRVDGLHLGRDGHRLAGALSSIIMREIRKRRRQGVNLFLFVILIVAVLVVLVAIWRFKT